LFFGLKAGGQANGIDVWESALMGALRGVPAMRGAIEAERRALEEEVQLLGKALEQLGGRETAGPDIPLAQKKGQVTRTRRSPGRRIRGKKTAAEHAAANREHIVTLLQQRGHRMPPEAIKVEVPMTQAQAGAAFKRLIGEGRVRRHGPTTRPEYEAVMDADVPDLKVPFVGEPRSATEQGTSGGRILSFVKANEGASEEELVERLDMLAEDVRSECGKLLREGEIRFARRDGRNIYVEDPSA
jgi:hypothetical protein